MHDVTRNGLSYRVVAVTFATVLLALLAMVLWFGLGVDYQAPVITISLVDVGAVLLVVGTGLALMTLHGEVLRE